MDDFERNTSLIVADFDAGLIEETEARGKLAVEFSASPVATRTVRRMDGTQGRLPMRYQTACDIEVGLRDLIVERTLDPGHNTSFRFGDGANYAGWARNFCCSALPFVAKRVTIQHQRNTQIAARKETDPNDPLDEIRPVSFGGDEDAMRAWLALDRWDEQAARSRASARLQASAAALQAITETPPLARLPRTTRRALAGQIADDPERPFDSLRRLSAGLEPRQVPLGDLFVSWTEEDADRFLALGNQERRRGAAMLLVEAAVADFPRPLRERVKSLETRLTTLGDGREWKQKVSQLVAAFIDTECEPVSALATAANTDARHAEHARNNAEFPQILAQAAAMRGCSVKVMRDVLVRSALSLGVVHTSAALPELRAA